MPAVWRRARSRQCSRKQRVQPVSRNMPHAQPAPTAQPSRARSRPVRAKASGAGPVRIARDRRRPPDRCRRAAGRSSPRSRTEAESGTNACTARSAPASRQPASQGRQHTQGIARTQHPPLEERVCVSAYATPLPSPRPQLSIQTPIPDRLAQVRGLDLGRSLQIRDGACDAQDAVVGARRQTQRLHGGLHQTLTLCV